MTFLKPHALKIYAVLRILAGLMFAQHGLEKLFDLFNGNHAPVWIQYGAGSIELVGGLLIAIGLFTSYAAFVASGTMAVAYFMHWFVFSGGKFFPIASPAGNGGELAALYCWVFLVIAAYGAGPWSVDHLRNSKTE